MGFVKASLFEEFDIPTVSHEEIKQQLIKVGKSHNVVKNKNLQTLPLDERLKLIQTEVYKILGRYKGFVKVIYNLDEAKTYFDKVVKAEILTLDTETNNSLDPVTCKIMGLCLYVPNTRPVYIPINHCKPGTEERLQPQINEKEACELLRYATDKGVKFIYHNAKFDIRVCNNTLGFYLPIWWDTMLAAQMLNENEKAGLKIQFKKYIDPTIDSYNIESIFKGVPYAWVDPEIFALYAATDAYDTYQLQQKQQAEFEKPGMERLYNLFLNIECPVTLVVAKMEDDGICLDEDFAKRLDEKYKKGLKEASDKLDQILMPYQQKIKYYEMEGKLDDPINYNSSDQLKIVMYDILGIRSPDGSRSTEKDTLKSMKLPFTEALLEYRHYNKMITSFTEPLPILRSKKDNKIHASFNQMGKEENNVRTGRFSSTDPNLQQIPSKEKVMRMMFQASEEFKDVNIENEEFEVKSWDELETKDGWINVKDIKVGDCIKIEDDNMEVKYVMVISIEDVNGTIKIRVKKEVM